MDYILRQSRQLFLKRSKTYRRLLSLYMDLIILYLLNNPRFYTRLRSKFDSNRQRFQHLIYDCTITTVVSSINKISIINRLIYVYMYMYAFTFTTTPTTTPLGHHYCTILLDDVFPKIQHIFVTLKFVLCEYLHLQEDHHESSIHVSLLEIP